MLAQSSLKKKVGQWLVHDFPRLSADARTLAAFRIAVAFALLSSSELREAVRFAALPPAQRIAPEGLGWFAALPFLTAPFAVATRALAVGAAVATLVGVYTRIATVLLLGASFVLLGLGQLAGTVVHDMHLVWFAAVLAVSPAGDAWSIDAWWDRAPVPAPAPRYGAPVWTARALFACVYFFPGLHKVLTQGLAWASVENLSLQLQWKWFEWGEVPSFRLDQHATLLTLGGLATLAFELGFPFAMLTRPTRWLAAGVGLCFHLATERFFRIPFSSLWLCYPVLFDWPLSFRVRASSPSPARDESIARKRAPARMLSVAALLGLVVAEIVQGVRGKTDAFPFACYPTFAERPPALVPDLRIVVIGDDGRVHEVPHARDARGVRPQTTWGRIWALAGVTQPFDEARVASYVESVRANDPHAFEGAARIEVRRAFYAVAPDASAHAQGGAPVREELLTTFGPRPSTR